VTYQSTIISPTESIAYQFNKFIFEFNTFEMESFLNAPVIWFLIGFAFLLLEFVVPGLILFFFAVGAWFVAILCLFFDPSINIQLVVFLSVAILTILFFRKWATNLLWSKKHSTELMEDEFLGKTAIAESYIGPGQNGKVNFKGTNWDAFSEDIIQNGENVIIIGNDSILLIVKSTKAL
jgi:membrane protein implicated in regulation of membrane protease activity